MSSGDRSDVAAEESNDLLQAWQTFIFREENFYHF